MIDFKELRNYEDLADRISKMTGVDKHYLLAHLRQYGVHCTRFSFIDGLELSPKLFMFLKALSVILNPYKDRGAKLCLEKGDDEFVYRTVLSLYRTHKFK